MFADAFLVQQRLGHEKVSTTLGTYDHLSPDRTNNIVDRLEALAFPVEKEPRYWFDPAPGVTFLLLWAQKSPAFKRKSLKAGLFSYVVLFYF